MSDAPPPPPSSPTPPPMEPPPPMGPPPPGWPPPPPHWPIGPGAGQAEPAPAALGRPGRGRVLGFVALGLIVLIAGAIVVRARSSGGPSYPKDWDPRVVDIARFDETHRGLQFDHPVYVDFLTPEEYSARTRKESSGLSDKDKQDLQDTQGELRAFGLISGQVDLLSAFNDLQDSGTLAFYDPKTKRVTVRGTEMTIDLRVTLAHELTHALQDQHFDLEKTRAGLKNSGQEEAYRALVEGDAVRIEDEYVQELSAADKKDYQDAKSAETSKAKTDLGKVPAALVAFQQSPYVFGPGLAQLIEKQGGNSAVDEAFRTPPTTEAQLLDPRAYFDRRGAVDVPQPALPDGVSASNHTGDFGALSLYLVLAQRIDPLQALDAVAGWAGDSFVDFQKDGRSCARVSFAGSDDNGTAAIRTAAQAWVAAGPAGSASVSDADGRVLLEACDPGADTTVDSSQRALQALTVAAVRSEIAVQFVTDAGLPMDKAFAGGTCFVHQFTFDQLNAFNESSQLTPEDQQAVQAAARTCTLSVGN